MVIKTLAFAENAPGIQVSSNKLTISLDKKTQQSSKFDAAFEQPFNSDEVFSSQLKKAVGDVTSGKNLCFVQLANSDSGNVFSKNADNEGIVSNVMQNVFGVLEKGLPKNEFLVTVSMTEVTTDNQLHDLINPHTRKLEIQSHPHHSVYVDGLSTVLCGNEPDLVRIYEDGLKVSKSLHHSNYATVLCIRVAHRKKDHPESETSANIQFVEINLNKTNLARVKNDLSFVVQQKGKGQKQAQASLNFEDILAEHLVGNNNTFLVSSVDGNDLQSPAAVLPLVEQLQGMGGNPKAQNVNGTVISGQIRQEIDKVRNRISGQTQPNKNDLAHMEKLIKDLDETKHLSWDQSILRSEQFYEERKTSFANRGLLHILESPNAANRENLIKFQKLKEKLSSEYKSQKHAVETLSIEMKTKIDNYTQLIHDKESKEAKKLVSAIQEVKERYQQQSEKLAQCQNKMKKASEQLERERQIGVEESSSTFDVAFQAMVEDRQRTKQENEQLVEDEMQKMKTQVDHDKASINMKLSSGPPSNKDIIDSAVELASHRAEKTVMTTQLEALHREQLQMEEHMRILAEKHARELEIQQLQNLQTFRAYREVFEEFKVELENRWRGLLDDAIQDAVFLNARNSELMQSNTALKRELAEKKDDLSMKKGLKS